MHTRLILRLLCVLLLAGQPALACTPPAVDAVATNTIAGVGTLTATLTTNQTNEIVVYYVVLDSNGSNAAPPAVTGVTDTAGLVWTQRHRNVFTSTCSSPCWPGSRNSEASEFWWAFSSGALTGDVITPTFSFAPTAFRGNAALGITGVTSSVAPWDSNGSLPSFNSGQPAPASIAVTTTRSADLILASCANMVAGTQCGLATGGTTNHAVIATDTLGGALISVVYSTPVLVRQISQPQFAGGVPTQWMASGDALIGDDSGCAAPSSAFPQVWISE